MGFDPSQPFETVATQAPAFDPSQPFEPIAPEAVAGVATAGNANSSPALTSPVSTPPPFDPAQPFDTALSPEEERQFKKWKSKFSPKDSGADYDFRGAFKAGISPDPETGHWPDTFKKANHPTFSNESIYASARPDLAGHWDGAKFIAPNQSPPQFDPAQPFEALPTEETIKPSPTVFGELKERRFKSAALLAKAAIGQALAPAQPDSVLQVHGAPPASILGTSEQLPADPSDSHAVRAGKAVVNVGNRLMAGLTSPEMMPLWVLGGAPGIGRVATGAFAGDMIANIPETWNRIKKADKTESWSQDRMETALDTALQATMLHGLAKHALGGKLPVGPDVPVGAPELPQPDIGAAAVEPNAPPAVFKSFADLPADIVPAESAQAPPPGNVDAPIVQEPLPVASEPVLTGADIFGFGPGAASAKEPLASYEKRGFGERLQQDFKLAQELRENIGDRYYEPIPNTVTVDEAIKITNERPVSDSINAIRDETSGIPFHVRATMGQMLVKRLNESYRNLRETNPVEADTILNHAVDTSEWLSRFGTELGQGVQAFSMWGRLTPEGKLLSVERSVRKSRDRYTAEHGGEVGQILDTLNTEGMTDAERFDALRKLFKTNTTASKVKPHIPKLLESARTGKLTDQKFYEIAGDRLGLPKWDKHTAAEIVRLAAKVDAAPEGMPRDRATFELSKFIATQKGFDARDVPIGIYYGNMLSGYNTQIVNSLDTFLNIASELNGLAVANPRAAAKIYHNAARGFLDGRLDFISALAKGRMVTDGKWLEVPKLMEVANFGRKGGVPINVKSRTDAVIKAISESRPATILNGWKYVTRLMSASDAFMYRGAYEARMALLGDRVARQEGLSGRALDKRVEELLGRAEEQTHRYELQAKSEGFTGIDAATRVSELRNMSRSMDARADADDFASLATYNHDPQGWLGYVANGLGKASQKYPLLKLFVPFTRIVANVTNRGLNYTPLGFKRAFYGYERGHPLDADARASMLARATFGTLGMTALAAMQSAGTLEINGAGPSDPERRRALEAAGWKPYSLKIGDHYWSYVYTPIGLGLSILGNMTDSYRYKEMEQKDMLTRAAYSISRIGSTVFSQSFLSGLSNLFQALGKPEEAVPALKNFFASTAGSISTPRIILDIQRLFDPTRYQSTTLAGDLLRNTPFAALVNRPALNAFGEPTTYPSNRFLSTIKPDPVWQLVVNKNLRVSVPDKYTEMPDGKGKGGRRRITPEEYYEVLEGSGKQLKQYVLDHMADFQQADPETAQKALDFAATGARGNWVYKLRKRATK